MNNLIDISPLLSSRLAVWPGDFPLSRDILCDMHQGDTVTLSTLRGTVHLGAHADAPNHYSLSGASIESRPLEFYIGPCQVIEALTSGGTRVTPSQVTEAIRAPRILLKTSSYPNPETFNTDFSAYSPELVEMLASHGVILVGIDTPSIDTFESKDLPAHAVVAKHNMAVLEGLVLDQVNPGLYELIALPLRLEGFDASPVRAVLRKLEEE